MATSFEDFLKNKNRDEKPLDWVLRKKQWLDSIELLHKNIQTWLAPVVSQSLLKINKRDTSVYEQYLGSYQAPQLDIVIGSDIILLIPKGTFILGSYGRIDMKGPKGEKLLVESKWNEWKFVSSTNRQELWGVNKESFESAIRDLING